MSTKRGTVRVGTRIYLSMHSAVLSWLEQTKRKRAKRASNNFAAVAPLPLVFILFFHFFSADDAHNHIIQDAVVVLDKEMHFCKRELSQLWRQLSPI